MKKIVWISSYPKSGNTWLRSFLALYQYNCLDINKLNDSRSLSRASFDKLMQFSSSYLSNDQLLNAIPVFYENVANDLKEITYIKTHDRIIRQDEGWTNFPSSVTKKAIYLVRNPFEVAVSYAHHRAKSINSTISHMNDSGATLNQTANSPQLCQWLGSWSDHVESWIDTNEFPVLVIKYEDMNLDPVNTFIRINLFLELGLSSADIIDLLAKCSFEELKKQEADCGFVEKNPSSHSFFRSGKTDSWRKLLSAEQISNLVSRHSKIMTKLGYIEKDN